MRSYNKQGHNLEIQGSQQQHQKQINIDEKQILKNKVVLNRLEIYGENNSFITQSYKRL